MDRAIARIDVEVLDGLMDHAVVDTVRRFAVTCSACLVDDDQEEFGFATCPMAGIVGLDSRGVVIWSAARYERRLHLSSGAFRYVAESLKQTVIVPFALSLSYPSGCISGYLRDEFIECLMGPSEPYTPRCPAVGLDVDHAELLSHLFELSTGQFHVQLAGQTDPVQVLEIIARTLRPDQIPLGVIDPLNLWAGCRKTYAALCRRACCRRTIGQLRRRWILAVHPRQHRGTWRSRRHPRVSRASGRPRKYRGLERLAERMM